MLLPYPQGSSQNQHQSHPPHPNHYLNTISREFTLTPEKDEETLEISITDVNQKRCPPKKRCRPEETEEDDEDLDSMDMPLNLSTKHEPKSPPLKRLRHSINEDQSNHQLSNQNLSGRTNNSIIWSPASMCEKETSKQSSDDSLSHDEDHHQHQHKRQIIEHTFNRKRHLLSSTHNKYQNQSHQNHISQIRQTEIFPSIKNNNNSNNINNNNSSSTSNMNNTFRIDNEIITQRPDSTAQSDNGKEIHDERKQRERSFQVSLFCFFKK